MFKSLFFTFSITAFITCEAQVHNKTRNTDLLQAIVLDFDTYSATDTPMPIERITDHFKLFSQIVIIVALNSRPLYLKSHTGQPTQPPIRRIRCVADNYTLEKEIYSPYMTVCVFKKQNSELEISDIISATATHPIKSPANTPQQQITEPNLGLETHFSFTVNQNLGLCFVGFNFSKLKINASEYKNVFLGILKRLEFSHSCHRIYYLGDFGSQTLVGPTINSNNTPQEKDKIDEILKNRTAANQSESNNTTSWSDQYNTFRTSHPNLTPAEFWTQYRFEFQNLDFLDYLTSTNQFLAFLKELPIAFPPSKRPLTSTSLSSSNPFSSPYYLCHKAPSHYLRIKILDQSQKASELSTDYDYKGFKFPSHLAVKEEPFDFDYEFDSDEARPAKRRKVENEFEFDFENNAVSLKSDFEYKYLEKGELIKSYINDLDFNLGKIKFFIKFEFFEKVKENLKKELKKYENKNPKYRIDIKLPLIPISHEFLRTSDALLEEVKLKLSKKCLRQMFDALSSTVNFSFILNVVYDDVDENEGRICEQIVFAGVSIIVGEELIGEEEMRSEGGIYDYTRMKELGRISIVKEKSN